MPDKILLTGASGFVGRHVVDALRARAGVGLRLLVHRSPVQPAAGDGVEHLTGDLANPQSLAGVCEGTDAVVHLASYIGEDEARCQTINVEGTRALVAEARRAGVSRIVYLSNAAVYGFGEYRGAREDEAVVAPVTPISQSRAHAERIILDAGGIVLRPQFVYGEGDTRFIPVLARAFLRLRFLVSGGRARLSVILVDDLAAALSTIAARRWKPCDLGVYHATDGYPISLREIAMTLHDGIGTPIPRFNLPYRVAGWILRGSAGLVGVKGAWSITAQHRLFLVSRDHFYDSTRLWKLVERAPTGPFGVGLADAAGWYRHVLDGPRRETYA